MGFPETIPEKTFPRIHERIPGEILKETHVMELRES